MDERDFTLQVRHSSEVERYFAVLDDLLGFAIVPHDGRDVLLEEIDIRLEARPLIVWTQSRFGNQTPAARYHPKSTYHAPAFLPHPVRPRP